MLFSYVPVHFSIMAAGISTYHATKYFLFLKLFSYVPIYCQITATGFPHIMQYHVNFSLCYFLTCQFISHLRLQAFPNIKQQNIFFLLCFFYYVPVHFRFTAIIITYHAKKKTFYFLWSFLMWHCIAELLLQAFPHIMQKKNIIFFLMFFYNVPINCQIST